MYYMSPQTSTGWYVKLDQVGVVRSQVSVRRFGFLLTDPGDL
jgi:hypothetical protein